MATKPEEQTPSEIVKQQQAIKRQDEDVTNKNLPSGEVPAGNPREHPTRQMR